VKSQLAECFGFRSALSNSYADGICYVIKNDLEAEKALQATTKFCDESGAALNIVKSAFMRINGCIIGPQLIAENSSLKILGLK
jgi:hypothetical protein